MYTADLPQALQHLPSVPRTWAEYADLLRPYLRDAVQWAR